MTVISSAPMPYPRLRLGDGSPTPATGQTAVTTPSASAAHTARPTYLAPQAFAPSVLYGARDMSGQGLGKAGRTRYGGARMGAASASAMVHSPVHAATVRPTYLMPHAFAPSVLYGAYQHQAQGMGRYGRRVRLAGIERFAPSVLYGAYTIQAQGMGRYRPMNRRIGCCGAPSRYAGYPVRRLGQNIFSDIASLFTPTPGGGSVTVDGQTQYVNAQGLDQSTPDPTAGQSVLTNPGAVLGYDASGLATAAASSLTSDIPWWGWGLLIAGGGLLAYKVLK